MGKVDQRAGQFTVNEDKLLRSSIKVGFFAVVAGAVKS